MREGRAHLRCTGMTWGTTELQKVRRLGGRKPSERLPRKRKRVVKQTAEEGGIKERLLLKKNNAGREKRERSEKEGRTSKLKKEGVKENRVPKRQKKWERQQAPEVKEKIQGEREGV